MTNSRAVLVIGNGESRQHVDVNLLADKFITVGCNAIHRDITVDHLVCCDQRMLRESLDNPNTKKSVIYVREEWYHTFRKLMKQKNVRQLPELPYRGTGGADLARNWGSGTYAHSIAAELDSQEVYMLGFDLYGVGNLVNNCYKGSNNYAAKLTRSVDPTYWIYQSGKIFNLYPSKKFVVVNTVEWTMPVSWKLPNIEFIDIDKFKTHLLSV